MDKRICSLLMVLVMVIAMIPGKAQAEAEASYTTLAGNDEIVLSGQTLWVDLAGYDLKVTGTGTVYAFDSANDGYDAEKCGQITAPATVAVIADVQAPNGNRYVAVTEEGVTTMHRLAMSLTTVTLNITKMGISYKAVYYCDEVLSSEVESYGVVLSLSNVPGADFKNDLNDQGNNENGFTRMQETLAVSSDNDYTVSVNSGAVFGIMKTDLDPATNSARGKLPIYANVYLAIDADGDGEVEYYMADTNAEEEDDVAWSLYDVMKAINDNWDQFAAAQSKVTAFYSFWAQYGMNEWEAVLPKIAA